MTMTEPMGSAGGPGPKKSGIGKILIIVGAIVLFFALGCCGIFTMCVYSAKKTIDQAVIDSHSNAGHDVAPEFPSMSLPDNFPKDVPVYPGLKISTAMADRMSDSGTVIFALTKNDLKPFEKFYTDKMPAEGWKMTNNVSVGAQTVQEYT